LMTLPVAADAAQDRHKYRARTKMGRRMYDKYRDSKINSIKSCSPFQILPPGRVFSL
jgi:hypothetical protein